MQATEQGVSQGKPGRYQVVPRTLIFVTCTDPASGGQEILLIKGAPTKRLWANKYNGIGGHVEPGEDILSAARRELAEETGLADIPLTLRGLINIAVHPQGAHPPGDAPSGVMVFVFCGHSPTRQTVSGPEGALHWIPRPRLGSLPLVDDLHQLLPLLLESDGMVYAHYRPDENGTMVYSFLHDDSANRC